VGVTHTAGVSSSITDPPTSNPVSMKKLTPAVQRLILAFTTGLFLACAAHVSGQGAMPAVEMTP
jgi:hypothetical protein